MRRFRKPVWVKAHQEFESPPLRFLVNVMLLTITTTHQPATDLGFLLHKNPARFQTFELNFGKAHVFYPIATHERCAATLMLDIDPVALIRNRRGPAGESFILQQYVNDRPYAASSFLSVAISEVYGSALSGTSRERPELTKRPLPLSARIAVLPCRGGEPLLRKLFEPLGYAVSATQLPLDETFPEWGNSFYYSVELAQTLCLRDMLSHLYVLIPVLDNEKHYWIGDDEVDKLLRHGARWLAAHPERELIVSRYLKHRRHLAELALKQLLEEDQLQVDEANDSGITQNEPQAEQNVRLNDQRLNAVVQALAESNASSVLDLGCSHGNLIRRLLGHKQFERIVGVDVSYRALEIARERLQLDRLPEKQRNRIDVIHGSLTYRDKRLRGYDAAAVIEVVEHLDESRLEAFERVLFEYARPGTIVMTTPNVEYNVRFEGLAAGKLRHRDHRFEWTREQFQRWAAAAANRGRYSVSFSGIGPDQPGVGQPTQMAVFTTSGR